MGKALVKLKRRLFIIKNVADERDFEEFVIHCMISSLTGIKLCEVKKIITIVDANASKLKIGA
jgi:hypothetical protein